jgi:hypothetical protein
MNKRKKSWITSYFAIGALMYLLVIPSVALLFSTCRIDGYLEKNRECHGPESFRDAFSYNVLGVSSNNVHTASLASFVVSASHNFILWPVGLIAQFVEVAL